MFCPPMMIPMDVNLTLVNEVTHVVASETTATRTVEANYLDTRSVVDDVFWTEGSVVLTNESPEKRKITYRWEVDLPVGEYEVVDDRLCANDGKAVFQVSEIVNPGDSVEVDWDTLVYVDLFGDLDGDGMINGADLGLMIAQWGVPWNANDLGTLLANWTEV